MYWYETDNHLRVLGRSQEVLLLILPISQSTYFTQGHRSDLYAPYIFQHIIVSESAGKYPDKKLKNIWKTRKLTL